MNAEKKLKGKSNALFCVLSLVLLVVLLFPLYWILVTSLKTEQEIFRIPPTLFPSVLNTDSYAAQLQSGDFNMFQSFGNSMIIALSCTRSFFPYRPPTAWPGSALGERRYAS